MRAEEIKKLRKELGLTQKRLAELVGVSTQTINGYENGKEIPNTKYHILDKILNNKGEYLILNEPRENYNKLPGYNKKKNERIDDIIINLNKLKTIEPDDQKYSDIIELIKLQTETLETIKIAKINHLNEK